ncbi:HAD-IA family hydrolase [Undibacterium sp. RTI2.1]|uniref:HAD family hydrolase n=1 Tax=unclassified Undibacterium TaxID=2630295 RepID=UPI002AB5D702|nr:MULTISPECIES: HAD-IA family hydrolase [unclassified Undibacterium]MDY7538747.1 HAD-IA family hydrolase [Undibacterium sp. 5I1]MEB0030197.1 HAD-IA family hydrolase [Undibacterium sp. RTI2.1]MEB0116821.1 HAD-IA family hydrolase [Undibacterium sp. RTI2.2]MEB0229686.1 HAD-IA family hydrolase [Undibacterium sp. 10I3]MEB0259323.1 HAD-IA family hydrolase [Undibacterium sp. 5I1]
MQTPLAVLFDLDGTLADTAPDLAAAVNIMRSKRQLLPSPYVSLRPFASAGARGLLKAGFDVIPDHPEYDAMRVEFLENYANNIADQSKLFPNVQNLLKGLEELGIVWGVVTNKAARLTDLLIPLIGLQNAACIISGDTTAHPKPHPAPLFEAARRINIKPQNCWYVGDDLRDIQAGNAAGMYTVAAAWGYCGAIEPTHWKAGGIVDSPLELLELIRAKHAQTVS